MASFSRNRMCTAKTSRTQSGSYGPTPTPPVDTEEVQFQAVMGDENKEWSKWTPSGQLSMSITNPEALEQFEVGMALFPRMERLPSRPQINFTKIQTVF